MHNKNKSHKLYLQKNEGICVRSDITDDFAECFLPAVHLDDSHAADDLIHNKDALICPPSRLIPRQ